MLEVDVSKRLGDVEIAATFTSPAGITALFGRSGAGKTSVVNMLAGLLRPDRGRICLDGRVLFDADAGIDLPPERRRLGYVFQDARLFPHMSVAGNLRYGMPRHGAVGGGRNGVEFDAVVEVLGLAPLLPRRPGTLSGGERQRVGHRSGPAGGPGAAVDGRAASQPGHAAATRDPALRRGHA